MNEDIEGLTEGLDVGVDLFTDERRTRFDPVQFVVPPPIADDLTEGSQTCHRLDLKDGRVAVIEADRINAQARQFGELGDLSRGMPRFGHIAEADVQVEAPIPV